MTDAQLKQIAMDLVDGKIFSSVSIPKEMLWSDVFLLIGFLKADQYQEYMIDCWMIYEYLTEASERGFANGFGSFPIFMSANKLTEAEFKTMREYAMKYSELKQAI